AVYGNNDLFIILVGGLVVHNQQSFIGQGIGFLLGIVRGLFVLQDERLMPIHNITMREYAIVFFKPDGFSNFEQI
ncbi:MAG: hypothetical protein WBH03_19520, partial [Cyclobacteriaceae bacterium]